MSKEQIRREIADTRKALEAPWLEAASARVAENLQSLDAFRTAKTIALYMAIGGEVDPGSLFPVCWKRGMRTCIPVFNAQTQLYEMTEITAETPCRTGRYGIREPIDPSPVALSEIDLVAVPGVAFDPNGNRLGRGGGYYDRLLEGFRGHVVGLAFDFQLLPSIPADAHDQPVGCIATESKILNI